MTYLSLLARLGSSTGTSRLAEAIGSNEFPISPYDGLSRHVKQELQDAKSNLRGEQEAFLISDAIVRAVKQVTDISSNSHIDTSSEKKLSCSVQASIAESLLEFSPSLSGKCISIGYLKLF